MNANATIPLETHYVIITHQSSWLLHRAWYHISNM